MIDFLKKQWNDISVWRGAAITSLITPVIAGPMIGYFKAETDRNKAEAEESAHDFSECSDALKESNKKLEKNAEFSQQCIQSLADAKDLVLKSIAQTQECVDVATKKGSSFRDGVVALHEQKIAYEKALSDSRKEAISCLEERNELVQEVTVCIKEQDELALEAGTYLEGMTYATEHWAAAQHRERGYKAALESCQQEFDAYKAAESQEMHKRISFK